jgi:hypothetical protein
MIGCIVPSKERALTGGLEMVMTATPSARTSMAVVPLAISGSGDAAGPEQGQCVERWRVDQQAVLLAELTDGERSLSYTESVSQKDAKCAVW